MPDNIKMRELVLKSIEEGYIKLPNFYSPYVKWIRENEPELMRLL